MAATDFVDFEVIFTSRPLGISLCPPSFKVTGSERTDVPVGSEVIGVLTTERLLTDEQTITRFLRSGTLPLTLRFRKEKRVRPRSGILVRFPREYIPETKDSVESAIFTPLFSFAPSIIPDIFKKPLGRKRKRIDFDARDINPYYKRVRLSDDVAGASLPKDHIWIKLDDEYVIRRFRNSDLKRLCELDEEMSKEILGPDAKAYDPKWLKQVSDQNRTKYLDWRTLSVVHMESKKSADGSEESLEADSSGPPIAFIMYHRVNRSYEGDDELTRAIKLFSSVKNSSDSYVELFWILVDRAHRRKGLAKALIQAMRQVSHNEWSLSATRLHCLQTNTKALSLYEKIGFQKTLLKKDYPNPGLNSWRFCMDEEPEKKYKIQCTY